jgi:SAM-dependent methyltransferase
MAIDDAKLQDFMGQAVTDMGAALATALVYVGDRLGYYRELAGSGPLTAAELAANTGTVERLAAEWLAGQAAGGYVSYDPATTRYAISEEQAFALATADSPVYLGGLVDVITSVYADVDRVVAAFRGDAPLGWHQHDERLFSGTERFFRPGYAANLVSSWIPALDGVADRLAEGIHVADVGCGYGASTIILAQAYPASTFVGFDYHAASIEAARKAASEAGVADRVTFEVATAQTFPGRFDLIALFDCLHDMGDASTAAAHVKAALNDGGSLLLVEPHAGDAVEDNLNPVGRLFYAASAAICLPNAVAQGGGVESLGAQAGEAATRTVFDATGWSSFRRATETPFNLVYEAKP